MGTNYYWHAKPPCAHCNHSEEPLHIGKSSFGWVFMLRIHPSLDINSLDDWRRTWTTGTILNEYKEGVTTEDMLAIITQRSPAALQRVSLSDAYYDPAIKLWRLKDKYVDARGSGTWDVMAGEFS